jgi:hypothetical protein
VGDTVQAAGRTITVTELDGRRISRLRVTATVPDRTASAQTAQAQTAQAQTAAAPGANAVSAGQVRLDSEAPHE